MLIISIGIIGINIVSVKREYNIQKSQGVKQE